MQPPRVAPLVVGVLAFLSAALTFPDTWGWLSEQRAASVELTPVDRVEAAGYKHFLPVEGFNFFRSHVRRGDRYLLLAPEGQSFPGVDRPAAARTFARYYLLPAVLVDDPRDATLVFSLGPDPAAAGLPLGPVERHESFAAARVTR